MKVYQGPYHHWFQPYRWAKNWLLWFRGCRRDKFDVDVYEAVNDLWRTNWFFKSLNRLERFVDSRHNRKIRVRIDYWDVWGADHTLAVIIVPMLKLLREKKQGAPFVDDDDVPEDLRSTAAPPVAEYDTDDNHFKRWDWVMDEMIWAMEQVADEDSENKFFDHAQVDENEAITEQIRQVKFDKEGYQQHQHRVDRGLRLFGKYFQALWD